MKFKFLVIPILLLILLVITVGLSTVIVSAQSKLQWSTPRQIPGYADDIDPPYLVADQNKTVHAFTSQWTGGSLAVFYNQWTLERGWTYPIDILLSPTKNQAVVLGAFLDVRGMMHVIFFGGTEQGAEIYYSRAPAVNAGDARAWSLPKMVGDHAGKLVSGTLTGDDKGNLYILYSGNREGNGLYQVHSIDGGDTWSEPKTVFLTSNVNLWIFGIQTTLDSQSRVHTVWEVVNKAGIAEAVYYAKLGIDQKQWSAPVVLATVNECLYKANWASIVPYKKELFVMYNCGAPAHRWVRRSSDGGVTWSVPVIAFSTLIGENGAPVFLVDGGNILHVVFANRTIDSTTHGVYHSQWDGDQWSNPEPIVSAPPTARFNPGLTSGVVRQGNLLLITWRQDPALSGNPVMYSYAMLQVSELPVIEVPTVVATSTIAPSVTATMSQQLVPTVTRFPSPAFTREVDITPPTSLESNPSIGILIAVFPVILILLVFVLRKFGGAV